MKTILLSLSLGILITGCDVRKKDKQASPVKMENLPLTTVQMIDSVYDFGKVTEGEAVEYSYRFKNVGNKPLVILERPRASCGCTIAEKPEEPIAPGAIGFIKVKFNSENRPGEAHKTISVLSNANPPFPELLLKGTVLGKEKDKE